jgi:hypothetical protein
MYDTWYEQQPTVSVSVMEVDARFDGGMLTICEFAGHPQDPEGKRRCKHFVKATHRGGCMHYRGEDFLGACDYVEVTK